MKAINQKYIRAKHPEIAKGLDLVIQVEWPQLVASIHRFSNTPQSEAKRREFLQGMNNPYSFAKANGCRIYATIVGSVLPVREAEVTGWNELMHQTLQEMAMFSANQMPDGMRRQYADE